MKYYQLIYLAEVGKQRSFNKASKMLYTSPSNVMVAINSLEEELGYKLLVRTKKGVSLTEDGERIVQGTEKIKKIKQKWECPEQGRCDCIKIHICAVPSVYHGILPEIVHKVMTSCPEIVCYTKEMSEWEINEQLPVYNNMLSITYIQKDTSKQDLASWAENWNIEIEELGKDRWCVFVAADHPLAQKEELMVEHLREYPLCCNTNPVLEQFYQELYTGDNILFFENQNHLLHVVANHGYVAVLPELFKNTAYVRSGQVVTRALKNADNWIQYYLLSPKQSSTGKEMQEVAELIRESFRIKCQK